VVDAAGRASREVSREKITRSQDVTHHAATVSVRIETDENVGCDTAPGLLITV